MIKHLLLKRIFSDRVEKGSMVSLANSFELAALFYRLGFRLVYACFGGVKKVSRRSFQLYHFQKVIFKMTRHHGATYCVK